MADYRPIYSKEREWINSGTPDGEIMTFHPTMEEFSNFSNYIETIERSKAHLASGVCKIIPPPGWHPRPSKNPSDYSDLNDFIIHYPVKERIEGGSSTGCYVKNNTVYRKEMRVGDYRRMALSKQFRPPKPNYDLNELERHFWRNLLHHEPIYGADSPGSIYDKDVAHFNMNGLGTILDLLKEQELEIKGVNTVFLYFGMWKTMFPWHVEDMDLYSINYLHFGEPKFWYAIPPTAAAKFERLAAQRFPDGLQICKAFLRHKVYIVSPSVLRTHGIPFGTMVQYPGEFIITFPRGYHMGFNLGYNCAESTNFALQRWIDYGKNAVLCYCRNDCVEIDMRPFMEKYRPNEYKEWLDYWYGEQPASYNRAKSGSKSSSVETSNSDASLPVPCTKRQKAIFKARKLMDALWANRPVDLYAEKVHNSRSGRLYPHCVVCQYFVQRSVWMKGTPVEKLPEKSKKFVSEQMFEKKIRMEGLDLGWTMLKDDKLMECSNCKVVVHASCYPSHERVAKFPQEQNDHTIPSTSAHPSSSSPALSTAEWLCERCNNRNDVLIRSTSCALCELRGGALKRNCHFDDAADSNVSFVHVICALMDPKARFVQQTSDEKMQCTEPTSSSRWMMIVLQSHQLAQRLQPIDGMNNAHDDLYCSTTSLQCSSPSPLSNVSTPPHLFPQTDDAPQHSTKLSENLMLQSHEQNASILTDSGLADTLSTSSDATVGCGGNNAIAAHPIPTDVYDHGPDHDYHERPLLDANFLHQQPSLAVDLPALSSSSALSSYAVGSSMSPHPGSSSNSCSGHYHAPTATEHFVNSRNGDGTRNERHPTSYQCEVCGHQSEHLVRCAICVDTKETGAKLRFHVTCAPLADVTFERREFPGALTVCAFHHSAQFSSVDSDSSDSRVFELKQRVIVDLNEEEEEEEDDDTKKDDRLIGYGLIYSISEHLYATVDFMDGTSSSEVFPCDIVDCECKMFGCKGSAHIPGALVYVRWDEDGKTYQAYYRGQNPRKKYRVKLYPPLSFELKKRKRAEEAAAAAAAADEGGEAASAVAKNNSKWRDDEVEVSSEMIYRRDDLHPEYIRLALLKRKSGESNGQKLYVRSS
uniref:[Histone H3]-trimethyl-L-lysine(9) demethylase n=1 Tax=Globodera rostochiensis TaxID=31243 RepID=A0A914HNN2_GLORO